MADGMNPSDLSMPFGQGLSPADQAKIDWGQKFPTESDIIKQQLARAKALREQQYQAPTGWGGLLSGLASGLNHLAGRRQEDALFDEMRKQAQARSGALGTIAGPSPVQAPSHDLPAGAEPGQDLSAPPMVDADASQPGQEFMGYGLGYQPVQSQPDPTQALPQVPGFMGQGIDDVLKASDKAMAPGMAQLSQPFGM